MWIHFSPLSFIHFLLLSPSPSPHTQEHEHLHEKVVELAAMADGISGGDNNAAKNAQDFLEVVGRKGGKKGLIQGIGILFQFFSFWNILNIFFIEIEIHWGSWEAFAIRGAPPHQHPSEIYQLEDSEATHPPGINTDLSSDYCTYTLLILTILTHLYYSFCRPTGNSRGMNGRNSFLLWCTGSIMTSDASASWRVSDGHSQMRYSASVCTFYEWEKNIRKKWWDISCKTKREKNDVSGNHEKKLEREKSENFWELNFGIILGMWVYLGIEEREWRRLAVQFPDMIPRGLCGWRRYY